MSESAMDMDLATQVQNIQSQKPSEPGASNCIDFELGDSGFGVRVIVTFAQSEWMLSTSIGRLQPGQYTPIALSEWSAPLRQCATDCAREVLDCFSVDEATKRVEKGAAIILLRFKEQARH